MEDKTSNPVVVTNQVLDQSTPVVPDLYALVPTSSGKELAAAACRRGLSIARNGGEVGICGARSECDTFHFMLMAEEGGLGFPGCRVPEPWHLVFASAEEPPSVY